MNRKLIGALITAMFTMNGALSSAVTLEEYGVQITSSGLVDTTNGLRWLSADLTLGTITTLDSYLENGWRIATANEASYLLTRVTIDNSPGRLSGDVDNPLAFEDFLAITNALGLSTNSFDNAYNQPWLCMSIYGDSPYCQTPGNWAFTPLILEASAAFPGTGIPGTTIKMHQYLTEVPIYGNFETGVCDTCIGRTLLVRNVPLPAGLWLLMSALVLTAPRQYTGSKSQIKISGQK